MDINTNIFRAYDIRGIAYEDLSEQIVTKLGRSLGSLALTRGETSLIIGRDGRNSSPDMYDWLSEGIKSTGCNVVNIGIVPTPLLYFSTHKLSSPSGVMITGSHNPANYNGFKIVNNKQTISGKEIQDIKVKVLEQNFLVGKGVEEEIAVVQMYLKELKNNIEIQRPIRLAIDCGNGAGSVLAQETYESLGCEVESIYSDLDGSFPNHHPDPSKPENLKDLIEIVLDKNLEIGLAFDGDADRLGVISSKGEIIYPDMQMILFVQDVLSKNKDRKIVFDVKCSKLLSEAISDNGGIPVMSKTGHSFIKDTLKKESAL
ncbi:MAG: phosphomannomutase/phosphoglucomutase, partial [Pseudomonadota bacterium]|nr:phosphomannomutase/phosphoglucomutase [Pseudomonadota bacterium]